MNTHAQRVILESVLPFPLAARLAHDVAPLLGLGSLVLLPGIPLPAAAPRAWHGSSEKRCVRKASGAPLM
eukprot:2886824-Pyramimonas_sp.AAC.1